ncbi:MAG TPA: hypothetical protein VN643_11630 [Pyrinomonadaceae bacterium]|nr:hypothetical protein [Pyrinomonadaceae bacterium]
MKRIRRLVYEKITLASQEAHVSHKKLIRLFLLVTIVLFGCPSLSPAQKKDKERVTGPAVLWREPVDITARNLLTGAGGDALKPDLSQVTFIKDETGGYSTKYRVRDAAGNEWVAKVGKEAQSETASNRLVWAVGYETEIVYLAPTLTIEGKGTFENVRLEARPKDIKREGEWSWSENPFGRSPELQGLKIMMVLINNWDMKDSNNQILVAKNDTTGETELRYIISDLGGSLGKTGGIFSRSRNKPSDFVKAEFIDGVKHNVIDFHYSGKNKALFEGITVEDARWLATRLRKLNDDQLKDAFRAANYNAEDVDRMAQTVREKIDLLYFLSQ